MKPISNLIVEFTPQVIKILSYKKTFIYGQHCKKIVFQLMQEGQKPRLNNIMKSMITQ